MSSRLFSIPIPRSRRSCFESEPKEKWSFDAVHFGKFIPRPPRSLISLLLAVLMSHAHFARAYLADSRTLAPRSHKAPPALGRKRGRNKVESERYSTIGYKRTHTLPPTHYVHRLYIKCSIFHFVSFVPFALLSSLLYSFRFTSRLILPLFFHFHFESFPFSFRSARRRRSRLPFSARIIF